MSDFSRFDSVHKCPVKRIYLKVIVKKSFNVIKSFGHFICQMFSNNFESHQVRPIQLLVNLSNYYYLYFTEQ